mmetsp:Transcript_80726/g.139980  ORF Transcript_80726/g.139980 Transcript_80726/m.139980 type:complete len:425 (-) Transcript_80726:17-1291(-)
MQADSAAGELQRPYELESTKHKIVTCAKDAERCVLDQMNVRIADIESSLQELGNHFIKYQEDFASILLQECSRLSQQMQMTRDQIQKTIKELVQAEVASVTKLITAEMNSELTSLFQQHDLSMTSKCKESPSVTESTVSASEDLELYGELTRAMTESQTQMSMMRTDIEAHMGRIEKRLLTLETSRQTLQREIREGSPVAPDLLSRSVMQREIRESSPVAPDRLSRSVSDLMGSPSHQHAAAVRMDRIVRNRTPPAVAVRRNIANAGTNSRKTMPVVCCYADPQTARVGRVMPSASLEAPSAATARDKHLPLSATPPLAATAPLAATERHVSPSISREALPLAAATAREKHLPLAATVGQPSSLIASQPRCVGRGASPCSSRDDAEVRDPSPQSVRYVGPMGCRRSITPMRLTVQPSPRLYTSM